MFLWILKELKTPTLNDWSTYDTMRTPKILWNEETDGTWHGSITNGRSPQSQIRHICVYHNMDDPEAYSFLLCSKIYIKMWDDSNFCEKNLP